MKNRGSSLLFFVTLYTWRMPNKKIYTNTIAQIAGKIATALISIFMIKILTNYLDIAGYGLYSKIYNYLSIFAVIADLGLYTITVRELTQYQNDSKMMARIAGNVLSLRTLSWGIIIFLSLSITPFLTWYNTREAIMAIGIVAVFTLFWLINSSMMSTLQSMLKTEFSFIATTSGKLLTFFVIIACAYLFFPNNGNTSHEIRLLLTVMAGLLGNIFMTFLTYQYTDKYLGVRFYWDKEYISLLLKNSLPYWMALFLGAIFFKIDVILLSIMEKHDPDTIIALYSLPMKIIEVGMMYGTIFLNSFLPVLTLAIVEKNVRETKKLTRKWFEILMGFWVAISVFLSFFAREIILIISNDSFLHTAIYGYTAVNIMQIVAWIFLFYFITSLANYTLIAAGEQKKILFVNFFMAVVNALGNFFIIPHYSFFWSAIVTLITQALLVCIMWFLVRKHYDTKRCLFESIFFLALGLLSGISSITITWFFLLPEDTMMTSFLRLSCAGTIFGILYLSGWFMLRKITKKTENLLSNEYSGTLP